MRVPRIASRASPHHRPANVPPVPVAPSTTKLDVAIARTNAIAALTTAGWKRGVATAAVDEASAHVGADTPFEVLVREAFRRCPKRTG